MVLQSRTLDLRGRFLSRGLGHISTRHETASSAPTPEVPKCSTCHVSILCLYRESKLPPRGTMIKCVCHRRGRAVRSTGVRTSSTLLYKEPSEAGMAVCHVAALEEMFAIPPIVSPTPSGCQRWLGSAPHMSSPISLWVPLCE